MFAAPKTLPRAKTVNTVEDLTSPCKAPLTKLLLGVQVRQVHAVFCPAGRVAFWDKIKPHKNRKKTGKNRRPRTSGFPSFSH